MAGSGVEIGNNVLIMYNDATPHSVASIGVSSNNQADSDWIIPGFYYPPCSYACCLRCITLFRSQMLIKMQCDDDNDNFILCNCA